MRSVLFSFVGVWNLPFYGVKAITSFLFESIFKVLAWEANNKDEKVYSIWIRYFDTQTQRIILDFPSRESDKNLVILESLKGI